MKSDWRMVLELYTQMKDLSNISEVAFVAALWAFKRRQRTTEPTAEEFCIPWSMAEVLARQVQLEFDRQVFARLLPKKKAA